MAPTQPLKSALPIFDEEVKSPSEQDWSAFKEYIIMRYRDDGATLFQVRQELQSNHHFAPTYATSYCSQNMVELTRWHRVKMYKTRLASWDIFKTVRRSDITALEDQVSAYQEQHGTSPDLVHHHGRDVSTRRIQRSLRRHRLRAQHDNPDLLNSSTGSSADRSLTPEPNTDTKSTSSDNARGKGSDRELALTGEDLATIHVAMLQTDHSLQSLLRRRDLTKTGREADGAPSWRAALHRLANGGSAIGLDPRVLTVPVGERELQNILRQIDVYHDYLAMTRKHAKPAAFVCSSAENASARDFYARSWVGILQFSKPASDASLTITLFNQVSKQIERVLDENHPHFLPWLCFVVCAPGSLDALENMFLQFSWMATDVLCAPNDPRAIIQDILIRSEFRRHLASAMLRQILDDFREKCTTKDQQDLKQLAELFSHIIEDNRQLTEEDVEPLLKHWARASSSIAEIMDERDLTDLQERPRQILEGTIEVD